MLTSRTGTENNTWGSTRDICVRSGSEIPIGFKLNISTNSLEDCTDYMAHYCGDLPLNTVFQVTSQSFLFKKLKLYPLQQTSDLDKIEGTQKCALSDTRNNCRQCSSLKLD